MENPMEKVLHRNIFLGEEIPWYQYTDPIHTKAKNICILVRLPSHLNRQETIKTTARGTGGRKQAKRNINFDLHNTLNFTYFSLVVRFPTQDAGSSSILFLFVFPQIFTKTFSQPNV